MASVAPHAHPSPPPPLMAKFQILHFFKNPNHFPKFSEPILQTAHVVVGRSSDTKGVLSKFAKCSIPVQPLATPLLQKNAKPSCVVLYK